ncbi:MAG: hypothetical protein AUH29_14595 [Candidatus Rokubacteria bacterium 13_1_40CM_69_27]|nr:MAG: hypothetical protein AUH29_14595 [Candidatus Rokubacteria bacterium 13_1_40CM_69_27]
MTTPDRHHLGLTPVARWALASLVLAGTLVLVIWLVVIDAPSIRFVVRLYRDKQFLKDTVVSWGWLAPLVFIAIQAIQVIISPIPGEITGPVGGALFGTWWGVIYSTIGLTAGTLFCFWVGRKWGEPLVRPWLSEHNWNRLNFILEAEGAILCFILYLMPGFPKDIISYLFGLSPMPFWLFALVSTLGRLPGTWISSYFGAHVAEQQYIYALFFMAIIVAICVPLYYYRNQFLARLGRKRVEGKGLDGRERRPVE